MSITGLVSIRNAISKLNPKEVREMSERPLRIALHSASPEGYQGMENFLLRELSPNRRRESSAALMRGPAPQGSYFDFTIYDESVLAPSRGLVFEAARPGALIHRILEKHYDLGVALAKHFPPFRRPFIDRVIKKTCREN